MIRVFCTEEDSLTDKRYARDNKADDSSELISTESFGTSIVGSSHPEGEEAFKGLAVRQLKVVRELGSERRETGSVPIFCERDS